jgi:hypothetical protein
MQIAIMLNVIMPIVIMQSVIMLNVVSEGHYAECHYEKRYHAECCCDERLGTIKIHSLRWTSQAAHGGSESGG